MTGARGHACIAGHGDQQTSAPLANTNEKKYNYLVSWWANIDKGFANGSMVVTLTNTRYTSSMHEQVQEYVRKECGRPNATVMSFSEFDG